MKKKEFLEAKAAIVKEVGTEMKNITGEGNPNKMNKVLENTNWDKVKKGCGRVFCCLIISRVIYKKVYG